MMSPSSGNGLSDCRSPGRGGRFSPVTTCSGVLNLRNLPSPRTFCAHIHKLEDSVAWELALNADRPLLHVRCACVRSQPEVTRKARTGGLRKAVPQRSQHRNDAVRRIHLVANAVANQIDEA